MGVRKSQVLQYKIIQVETHIYIYIFFLFRFIYIHTPLKANMTMENHGGKQEPRKL